MQFEGLTLLTGKILGPVTLYNDSGPKAVFTLLWRGIRWYVESNEAALVRQAEMLAPNQEITVIGYLFPRGGKVGVRASKIFN
jgi:hypothetical protein